LQTYLTLLGKNANQTYLFYIQAPEIVHEDAAPMLKAIPEIFAQTDTFSLPYSTVISNFKVQEEFRMRFIRNIDSIVLTSDAWTFSTSKQFIKSEALRSMRKPKKLMNYVGRGIEWTFADTLNNVRCKAVYLPKPIFRYPVLFKHNFIERCKGHTQRLNLPNYNGAYKEALNEQGDSFFTATAQLHRRLQGHSYPDDLGIIKIEDHPKIMRELITNGTTKDRYYIRDSILNAIKNT
jgi:hypothetical protein